MSENEKSIGTRRHSLPKFLRSVLMIFSPRRLLRYFFFLACLATIVALFYAEEDLRGKFAWKSYERQSAARGFELDWHAYVPPPVPDKENFAMTPLFDGMFTYSWQGTNNSHRVDTNLWARIDWAYPWYQPPAPDQGDWVKGEPLDLKLWQAYFRNNPTLPTNSFQKNVAPKKKQWPVPAQPGKPSDDVLLALSKLDPELTAVRKASLRPQSRFPIHYDELPNALVIHLAFLNNISRILRIRAIAELQSGRNQQALADFNLALYCAESIKSDAFLISQIVRARMIEDVIQPIWEGLRAHQWSEPQLAEIQRELSKIDLLLQFEQSTKADLAFLCGWIEFLPDDMSSYSMDTGSAPNGLIEAALEAHLLPQGWCYQNELSAARFFQEKCPSTVAPQIQRVYPGVCRTNAERFASLPSTPYSFAFKHLGGVTSPQRFAHSQTDVNLALVACALERFRMARGHLPERLDALSPDFLEKLPHDIINGEPLKYSLTGTETFVLYSVGWNEKDDGGAFPRVKLDINRGFRDLEQYRQEAGDWVWKYPAASASR